MKIKRATRPPAPPRDSTGGPFVAYGPPLFGKPDELDGTRVNGHRLVRAPGGGLVGIREPQEPDR